MFLWGRRIRKKLKFLLRHVETMMVGCNFSTALCLAGMGGYCQKDFLVLGHYSPDPLTEGTGFSWGLWDFFSSVHWQFQAGGSTLTCLGYMGAIRKPVNLLPSQASSLKVLNCLTFYLFKSSNTC